MYIVPIHQNTLYHRIKLYQKVKSYLNQWKSPENLTEVSRNQRHMLRLEASEIPLSPKGINISCFTLLSLSSSSPSSKGCYRYKIPKEISLPFPIFPSPLVTSPHPRRRPSHIPILAHASPHPKLRP